MQDKNRKSTQEKAKTRLIRINVTNVRESFLLLLRSPDTNPRVKALVLLLFTGRRSCKVLATGKFLPIPGKTYCARFQGQLKNDGVEKEYIIPLLAPVEEIIAAVEQVRQQLVIEPLGIGRDDYERREKLKNKFAKPLKQHLQNIMAPFTRQKMRPHDLRSLYVVLTYHACNYTNYTLLPFSEHVLGHASVNATTAYHRFKATGLDSFSCPMDISAEDLGHKPEVQSDAEEYSDME
jgi:integrase